MLKSKLGLIILISAILIIVYNFYSKNPQLKKQGISTKAVIISEEVYSKNAQMYKPENRIHKYSFVIDGITYKGNSQSAKYKIGDTMIIRYLPSDPSKNNPEESLKE